MYLIDVTNRGAWPLLARALSFTEARHRTLAENIANVDTPGYRTKQLDAAAFQASLREAVRRRGSDPAAPLALRRTRQVQERPDGSLRVTPATEPPDNLLFHDGTNGRIERQMSALSENAVAHQLLVELMKGKFNGIMQAIRGRVT